MKKKFNWLFILMILFCFFYLSTFVTADDLELAPYMIINKSSDSNLKVKNGHGLMLIYSPIQTNYGDIGLFTSFDMQGIELFGRSVGNLNIVMLGPVYRTPTFWNYFSFSTGGGLGNAHDSDMEYTNYSNNNSSITKKVKYDTEWGMWATLNFTYPIAKKQTLGLKFGGRYIDINADVTEISRDSTGTTERQHSIDPEPFSVIGILEWRITF